MRPPRKSPSDAETSKGAVDWPVTALVGSSKSDATGCVNPVQPTEGGRGAGCGRVAPAPAPAALPCLNRNNCIQPPRVGGPKYRFKRLRITSLKQDRDGIIWDEEERSEVAGHHWRLGGQPLTGADRKRAFTLRNHVEAFVKYWERNHSVFFTTTDKDGVNPKVYARRWHSLLANEGDWLRGYIRVLEPQKNGRPHFHNLTSVAFDTRPDEFDWEAFNASTDAWHKKDWGTFRKMRERYKASAVPELVNLWKWGREKMPLYGLGRCEILPIRKQGAIAHYIGKYLDKGMSHKIDAWKGVRRFETDRRTSEQWKRCGSKFSWVSPGARQWRRRCAELALALGLQDSGDSKDLTRILGPRWAYSLRGAMTTGSDEEFTEICSALGASYGGKRPGNFEVIADGFTTNNQPRQKIHHES